MARLLIVDDSALMRRILREILLEGGEHEIRTACDGEDALRQLAEWNPDLVTLDINMPQMDGLTCLARIMTDHPRPVVMVSSLTAQGALSTLEALQMGAVDFVTKPSGTVSLDIRRVKEELRAKVKAALGARARRSSGGAPRQPVAASVAQAPASMKGTGAQGEGKPGLVMIGSSTGGPQTLELILPLLPADFPLSVLVAQHMPGGFTRALAERLNAACQLKVGELSMAQPLRAGQVWIARGDADVTLSKRGRELWAVPTPYAPQYLWHPSVERMVESALGQCQPSELIGVQLTGMGHDGAEALAQLHRRGGRTIAEAEHSCVVYGMPRALVEKRGASVVLGADKVAAQLVTWARAQESRWAS